MAKNQSKQVRCAAICILVSSVSLAACGNRASLDARAAEPSKEITHPQTLDPALDRLEAVTHHG